MEQITKQWLAGQNERFWNNLFWVIHISPHFGHKGWTMDKNFYYDAWRYKLDNDTNEVKSNFLDNLNENASEEEILKGLTKLIFRLPLSQLNLRPDKNFDPKYPGNYVKIAEDSCLPPKDKDITSEDIKMMKSKLLISGKEIKNLGVREIFFQNESEEDLQLQEAISQSFLTPDLLSNKFSDELQMQETLFASQLDYNKKREENVDQGWLTDDNIEYILKNDEVTRQAKNIQIKTDIANIYFQVNKAQRGETVDEDFWNSLDTKKKYIILPLRVSGNHWSLLLFMNNEYSGKVNWLYYISSLDALAANQEVEEIELFLKQVGKRFGTDDNAIINENNLSEVIFQENPRQPNTWDCGVYLCKFAQFLCENEYYNLNELFITPLEVKAFRTKWKESIGEEKWCKWDIINNQQSKNVEDDTQLQEALRLSLLINEEDAQLQEALSFSFQPKSHDSEAEILRKELAAEKDKNELLSKKLELLELINKVKTKLDDKELLDDFLEAQEEYIQTNSQFAKKQFDKNKKKLLRNEIFEQEVDQICQLKEKIVKLEKHLVSLQNEQQAQIIQPTNPPFNPNN